MESPSLMLCQRFKMADEYRCSGDSGGPLVVKNNGRFILAAVASTVPGIQTMYSWPPSCVCSCEILPETHARVSIILPWIYKNLEERKLKIPCMRDL